MRRCPLFQWKLYTVELEKHKSRNLTDKIPFVEKIEYHLHPTFAEPVRVIQGDGPFEVVEEGYGSFDIKVVIHFKNSEQFSFTHSLILEKPRNDSQHTVKFKDPSEEFTALLLANFPEVQLPQPTANQSVPAIMERPRKRLRNQESRPGLQSRPVSEQNAHRDAHYEKVGGILYGYSVDELTDRLYSLKGDAVFKAVDLVKKYRTQSSFVEDSGSEFHFDLFTLSPDAVHALWDLTAIGGGTNSTVSPTTMLESDMQQDDDEDDDFNDDALLSESPLDIKASVAAIANNAGTVKDLLNLPLLNEEVGEHSVGGLVGGFEDDDDDI